MGKLFDPELFQCMYCSTTTNADVALVVYEDSLIRPVYCLPNQKNVVSLRKTNLVSVSMSQNKFVG